MTIINGVKDKSRSPGNNNTLDELLKDKRFGLGERHFARRNRNEDVHLYRICLGYFIRGYSKDCLEKMYEFGLLKVQVLAEDDQVYALFQGACDAVKNFNNLGIRLQDVVKSTFNGDMNYVKDHVSGKSRSFEIALLNKYYRCCTKVLDLNEGARDLKANSLEAKIRKDIGTHSSIPLFHDPDSIVELERLVETYIFNVQLGLLHEPLSPSLYQKLCEASPGLSQNLKKIVENGKTAEEQIIDKLLSKERKHKKTRTVTSPSRTLRREETLSDRKREEEHDESLQLEDQNRKQVQFSFRLVDSCYRYINKLKFSRQTLIITLLLLLLSARKIKNISKVPHYVTYCVRSAMPFISKLLKLLSSI